MFFFLWWGWGGAPPITSSSATLPNTQTKVFWSARKKAGLDSAQAKFSKPTYGPFVSPMPTSCVAVTNTVTVGTAASRRSSAALGARVR